MKQLREYLRREGWLVAALAATVALCLLLGAMEGGGQSAEETRIARVLSSMAGAGKVEVAVYASDAVPCGAVVVADGASDAAVRIRLAGAVAALLGLDSDRVAVYEREGSR